MLSLYKPKTAMTRFFQCLYDSMMGRGGAQVWPALPSMASARRAFCMHTGTGHALRSITLSRSLACRPRPSVGRDGRLLAALLRPTFRPLRTALLGIACCTISNDHAMRRRRGRWTVRTAPTTGMGGSITVVGSGTVKIMILVRMDNFCTCSAHLGGGDGAVDSRMALDRRDDWSGVGDWRWSPWGTALCDVGADRAGGGEAVLGPITLSDYDADRRGDGGSCGISVFGLLPFTV